MHRSCNPTLSVECYLVATCPVLAGQGMFLELLDLVVTADVAAVTGLLTLW